MLWIHRRRVHRRASSSIDRHMSWGGAGCAKLRMFFDARGPHECHQQQRQSAVGEGACWAIFVEGEGCASFVFARGPHECIQQQRPACAVGGECCAIFILAGLRVSRVTAASCSTSRRQWGGMMYNVCFCAWPARGHRAAARSMCSRGGRLCNFYWPVCACPA